MRWSLAIGVALCTFTTVWADDVELPTKPSGPGPTNNAVLLPPEVFDVPVKGPNTTRERYGEFTASGGILLLEPTFSTNPAFSVGTPTGRVTRQVEFNHRLEAAPDVWLGYVSEQGWGVRG